MSVDNAGRDERGTIVVLVALSVTTMLIIAALVVDGGGAYAERRRQQNAADAAAMAGAQALDAAKLEGTASPSAVAATVDAVSRRNGADSVACTVVTAAGVALGSCTDAGAVVDAAAAGVRVEPVVTRPTAFGRVAGQPTLTVRAQATATIQPLVGLSSPFVICGSRSGGGYDFLDENGRVDAAKAVALGEMAVHGSQVPDCDAGDQMKGLNGSDDVRVGTWIDPAQGRRVGQYRDVVAGGTACGPDTGEDDDLDGCDVVIPIADQGVCCGASARLRVADFAVFRVRYVATGNVSHYATFQRTLDRVSDGLGGMATVVDPDDLRLIRLIE